MNFRTSARTSASTAALLALGWIVAAGLPGPARASDPASADPMNTTTTAHSAPISNGTAVMTPGHNAKPEITYTGQATGDLNGGMPFIPGQTGSGSPITTYRPAPASAAAPAPASAAAVASPAPAMPQQVGMPADTGAEGERLPGMVHTLLTEARQALRANRLGQARQRLEQAETALLNARVDGEHGDTAPLREIGSVRSALAGNDRMAAERALAPMLDRPAPPAG